MKTTKETGPGPRPLSTGKIASKERGGGPRRSHGSMGGRWLGGSADFVIHLELFFRHIGIVLVHCSHICIDSSQVVTITHYLKIIIPFIKYYYF